MIKPAKHACRLEDISLVYRTGTQQVNALSNINVTFDKGSFWAIMGSSGSGKSSLLNLLGCLDRPSAGRYYIEEQVVSGLDDNQLSELRLRRLGFIFQSFHLITQLTVQENIELPLLYLNKNSQSAAGRAQELAARVGLADRLGHLPSELSGGQQQRVAVARAIANKPAILLADEPTGNLDTSTSQQIMELLKSLHAQETTILMVTHEEHIASWAEKKLHLRDGKIDRIVS